MKSKISFIMNKKKKITMIITLLTVAMLIAFGVMSNTVFASASSGRSKLITLIQIEEGDTLWDIASEYKTKEYHNITEYIDEIKSCNGIETDTIHKGQYLLVPYYGE